MRKRFESIVTAVLLVTILAFAGDGKKYGKELTLKEKTPLADILKNPEKFDGKRVLVEGVISEVCQMMGCWIRISDKTVEEPVLFKVDDGVIEFPKDAQGKTVRAEGIVSVKTSSKEELIEQARHEADEQGKEFDPASMTGPKTVVQINGEGAVIFD